MHVAQDPEVLEGPPSTSTQGKFQLHMPRGPVGAGDVASKARVLTHRVSCLAWRALVEGNEPGAPREGQQEGNWSWGERRGWLVCTLDMSCAKSP